MLGSQGQSLGIPELLQLSRIEMAERVRGDPWGEAVYSREESEGRDYNEDTNFGRLKGSPHKPLHRLLKKHRATYVAKLPKAVEHRIAIGVHLAECATA